MSTQKVTVNWKQNVLFASEGPGGSLMIDGSEAVGGQGKGLRPKALMLSALAGCSGIDIAMLLKKMRVEVKDFTIEVTGELTDENPKYFKKVLVTFTFFDSEFKKDKIQKAVDLSVEKYCGVMEMFRKFAEVVVEVKYVEV